MTRLAICLALVSLLAAHASAQTTYTWNGANPGSWTNAVNWAPTGVPGGGDTAIITNGRPELATDATVAFVTLSGGMLSGDGNLTVTDTFVWSGGTLDGRAYAETAAVTIPVGAVLLIQGDAQKTFNGRDLINDGTVLWEGTGDVNVAWGTLFENRSGATFDIRNDARVARINSGMSLINEGLIVKSAGTGTTSFDWNFGHNGLSPFDNQGTLRIETGQVEIAVPCIGSGLIEVPSGAELRFRSGPCLFDENSTLNVAGRLSLTTSNTVTQFLGTVNVMGLTVITAGSLEFNGATPAELGEVILSGGLLGGLGVKNVNGLVTWQGGTLGTRFDTNEDGVLNLLGGVLIEGESAKHFGGGTYNNVESCTWTGTGELVANTGGTFINLEGALFDIQTDAQLTRTNGGLQFDNRGLMVKSSGTGTTTFNMPFRPYNNDGEVRVEVGTLNMNVHLTTESTDTGAWIVEEGAVLRFASHQRTFTETASISGDGAVNFADATVINRGTIRSGLPLDTLTVQGNLPALQPEGVMEVELGGLVPGTEHDVLAVTGTANLAGTLRLVLVNDYNPAVNDTYTILTAASVVGTFAAVEPPEGVSVDVAYGTTDVTVTVTTTPVANEAEAGLPTAFALHAPYPNPTSATATFGFYLPEAAAVRVTLYDVLGREVAVLVDAERAGGSYEVALAETGLPSGVYLVRLTAGEVVQTRRMTLLR